MSDVPIAQHALLSDCGGAALVTSGGSVDWLCLPRFDSQPAMARLLDDGAGHFLVGPAGGSLASTRRYLPRGLVLETTYESPDGVLVTTDALALGAHERGHGLGRTSPGVLLRTARCVRGEVAVRVEFAPRPEFGLVHSRLSRSPKAVVARGGPTVLVLSTELELDLDGATGATTVTLREGEKLAFALEQARSWDPEPERWSPRKIRRRLASTERSWRSWSDLHQSYEGPYRALVLHSGVVLQGLTDARTGAVVAAPTTSLPEGAGTARTWDYRFTWVRDASMTMQGLWIAACPDEAEQFFAFLSTAAATQLHRGLDLQIMFGVGAERDLTEKELPHLTGWRHSAPVRVGNDAWSQRQLDVYGALLDAAYTLRNQLERMDEVTRGFLMAAVDAAVTRWQQEDQGIWEIRGTARHYLHSKLMCWVAVDRGLAMASELRAGEQTTATWAATRDEIRQAIEEQGWNDRAGAFTQHFGSDDLDASALLLAIVGFLPADDPRLLATIDAVEDKLSDGNGLIYRYRGGDGLQGDEGSFLLCTFWLVQALAVTGQVDRSRAVLDRAARCANDLGLFSEQVEDGTGELLGNFPQAFSHLGLVTAAHALAVAERALDG
ncbi:MAG: glycoside hydrolase family 15 protein [Nocardioidaceae bacterium]